MITLKTNEPIKITVDHRDGILSIFVDGFDYAVIDYVDNIEQISMEKVKYWVEETYYGDECYKDPCYIVSRLDKAGFLVEAGHDN